MTAVLTVHCNGPDCPATVQIAPHADGGFDVPQPGWLHVHVDGPDGPRTATTAGGRATSSTSTGTPWTETAVADLTPTRYYRAAAEAYFEEAYAGMPWNPRWAEHMAETPSFRAAVDAVRPLFEAAGREATLADLRNRPACDCGHEFEPDPSWFHLAECSYRRGVATERADADA